MNAMERIREIEKRMSEWNRPGLQLQLKADESELLLHAFKVMRQIAIAETDGHADVDAIFEEAMKKPMDETRSKT